MKNELKRKFSLFKKRFLTLQTAKMLTNVIYIGLCIGLMPIPIHYGFKMLLLGGFYLFYMIITGIIKEIEADRKKIPLMSKRFTEKHENGAITIDENRFREAILYLYEIEDKIYGKQ